MRSFLCKVLLNKRLLLCLVLLLSLLSSCASDETSTVFEENKEYVRGDFKTQILTFHPDHKHMLTNRDANDIKTYDLRDPALRETLDKLYFSCKIGKKHYYICQNVAGICRRTNNCLKYKNKWYTWTKKDSKCIEREIEVITTEDHDFLVKSGVHCMSEMAYSRGI